MNHSDDIHTDDYLVGNTAAYDQIAPVFRSVATPHSIPDALVAYAERIIQHLGQSERLIDIGCGVGNHMSWFAERGAQTVGIDISMGMLSFARQETDQPLSCMSMPSLGFANHTFGAAWCSASMLHLPKAVAPIALREIARVTKPGGLLMVSVQVGEGEAWNGGYVDGVKRFFARYRAPEITELFQMCGFEILDQHETVDGPRVWLATLCQLDLTLD